MLLGGTGDFLAPILADFVVPEIWGWVKTLVASEPQVIAGIYGCE